MELVVRVYKSDFSCTNYWEYNRALFRSAFPAEFHPQLGWIPKQGEATGKNIWNTRVSILSDGIRSNGKVFPQDIKSSNEVILTVGDSFTFGDQVSDDESWPAYLEQLINIKTINGGVFGYGLDQIFLRMISLSNKYKPTYVVLSFIDGDISRCGLRERTGVAKPYFEINNHQLSLKTAHIQKKLKLDKKYYVRYVLGYSRLIHELMMKYLPEYWLQGSFGSKTVNNDCEAVACKIMQELNIFLDNSPHIKKLYVLGQYGKEHNANQEAMMNRVLSSVNKKKIQVLDLRFALNEIKANNPEKYERFYNKHMTAEGNYFVARKLSEFMSK